MALAAMQPFHSHQVALPPGCCCRCCPHLAGEQVEDGAAHHLTPSPPTWLVNMPRPLQVHPVGLAQMIMAGHAHPYLAGEQVEDGSAHHLCLVELVVDEVEDVCRR